ncbi:MAG: HEAT repeat domain-containing protein [Candidatus Obscuribacterales bacterium]|jgi:vesicle coat complex subunit|nr:HEAT repeat domain-containing protein [Candidatus Obscuribacterales bacterium]
MDKELENLAAVVEDMILQLSYPGFDERSLKLGLPDAVSKYPPKTYGQALKHESTVVRLAAMRWFQERPGIAKTHLRPIVDCLEDVDGWVRREAISCLEKLDSLDNKIVEEIAELLVDRDVEVRKSAAKALGKIGSNSDTIIGALQQASEDENHEVRWKAQKALRKLGAYSSSS